jgi:hypothetical protein
MPKKFICIFMYLKDILTMRHIAKKTIEKQQYIYRKIARNSSRFLKFSIFCRIEVEFV